MDRLSDLLPDALKKRGFTGLTVSQLVFAEAREWLRKEMPAYAARLHLRSFQNGILVTETVDGEALAACFERAEELRRHLQTALPDAKVVSVRLVQTPA